MVTLIVGVILMFLLLAGGLWIAFSIGVGGFVSLWPVLGIRSFSLVGNIAWATGTDFVLCAVPLYVFMGEIMSSSGILDKLFTGLSRLLHGIKGELLQSAMVACTIFAACSGSSMASAATLGGIIYPDLAKRGYDKQFIVGSVAAGGTLGILIPPSIVFIVYGLMSNQSIGRLFMAGLFPGLIMAALFMAYIAVRAHLNPRIIPPGPKEKVSLRVRQSGFVHTIPFLLLIILVLGSIYTGLATPTESAALGCAGVLVIAAVYRRLSWKVLQISSRETLLTFSMLVLLFIAAKVMGSAVIYYHLLPTLEKLGAAIGSPLVLFIIVVVLYIILGCIFDVMSMVVLTLPFLVPIISAAGIDIIWFGVIVVILFEMGELTPPIGMNLFVLQGVTGVPLMDVAKGSLPYVFIQLMLIIILYLVPQIALWLPNQMYS